MSNISKIKELVSIHNEIQYIYNNKKMSDDKRHANFTDEETYRVGTLYCAEIIKVLTGIYPCGERLELGYYSNNLEFRPINEKIKFEYDRDMFLDMKNISDRLFRKALQRFFINDFIEDISRLKSVVDYLDEDLSSLEQKVKKIRRE